MPSLIKNIEAKLDTSGHYLVAAFHYLMLALIGVMIIYSAFQTVINVFTIKKYAAIEGTLLLCIYLELGAIARIYLKTNPILVRF